VSPSRLVRALPAGLLPLVCALGVAISPIARGTAPTAAGANPAAPRLDLRFASPTIEDILEGPATLEVIVTPIGEIGILKVDFYVDGKRVGWADDPPYRTAWDAGSSLKARQVRAVAYGSDGKTYEVKLTTKEIRVDYRASVELVNVFATVRDFAGDYAGNLDAGEFEVLEDGVGQKISNFLYEDLPLDLVFLMDASKSMEGERIATAREAADRFARTLNYGRDRAMLISFAGDVTVHTPLTNDRVALLGGIGSMTVRTGGTVLYDGVMAAIDALRPVEGRKAILLLSDGRDESGDGFRPGSSRTFEEALEAAQKADVILYTIGIGKEIAAQKDFHGIRTVGEVLSRFADETGGRCFFAQRVNQLRRAYETVAQALRHQYSLGYVSTNTKRDGAWRSIRLICKREGYTTYARKGYYGPKE
jgi:VWFA-related protein